MAKILLVEDNEMNRDLISRRLRRRGYEIALAVDGGQAVEKATSEAPDLILMDMGLPVLDGYEATRRVKASETTRHIPIIGLSAHAMSGDAEKALEAGCDDYDTKPVEWKRLLEKISKLLSKAEARSGPTAALEEGQTMLVDRSELIKTSGVPASHVLVVDDSPMHREVLSRRLGELGVTSEQAAGAKQALTLLENKRFDAVLLDIAMPEMSGEEILRLMKKEARWENIPVLMLSTVDTKESALECLEHGAEDIIPQPFHVKILATRLRSALERRQLRSGGGAGGDGRFKEHLMRMILPPELMDELKSTGKILPRQIADTVLIELDVAGFSELCDDGEPLEVLGGWQELLIHVEDHAEKAGLRRIKTAGASLLLAAGLFSGGRVAPQALMAETTRTALDLFASARNMQPNWIIRIGIHAGPVLAGVVGRRNYQFDLWGTTVETVHRMVEAIDDPGVHASAATWQTLSSSFRGQAVGEDVLSGMIYRIDAAL